MTKKDLDKFVSEFVFGDKKETLSDFVYFEKCYSLFMEEMGYSKEEAEQKDKEFGFSKRLMALQEDLKLLGFDLSNPHSIGQDELDIMVFLGVKQMKQALFEAGDNDFIFQCNDGVLVSYNGSDADVVVPNNILKIGEGVFEDWDFQSDDSYGCSEHHREVTDLKDDGTPRLKSVVLPNSVKIVGDRAFYNCKALEKAVLPEVLEIGAGAFHACKHLVELNLPNVCEIGTEAFFDCLNLPLPNFESIEMISARAFKFVGVYAKQHLRLPNSLQEIGEEAFSCSGVKTLQVPSTVKKIGKEAFSHSTVQKAEIFSHEVSESMFESCHSLTEVLLSNDVKIIGKRAFAGCDKLSKIVIPKSVEEIGEEAFSNFGYGLKHLTFEAGSNLKKIGKNAFANCKLEQLEIPTNVEFVEGLVPSAFKKFSVCKDNAFFAVKDGALYKKGQDGKPVVLVSFFDKEAKSYTMPDTVEVFDQLAFANTSLTEINFSKSLKSVPSMAFEYCKSLKKLTFASDSVTEISESAFFYCTASEIILPENGMKSVPKFAFARCKLNKLQLPKCLKEIKSGGFVACTVKGDLVVPNGVETIGESAFGSFCAETLFLPSTAKVIERFSQLAPKCFVKQFVVDNANVHFASIDGVLYQKSSDGSLFRLVKYPSFKEDAIFVMPNSVTEFDENAFCGNDFLTKIVLSKSLKCIPSNAFCECKGLKKLDIPATLKCLSFQSFYKCTAEKLVLPEGIEDIPKSAFLYAEAKTIVLPSSVKSIGKSAFSFCRVEEINIPEGVGKVADEAFRNCEAKKITLPKSLKAIGKDAFCDCKVLQLELPSQLESIDDGAFAFCENLAEIKIPNSVRFLGKRVFLQRAWKETKFKKIYAPLRFKETVETWADFKNSKTQVEIVYFESDN